jgi:hypothetical protein
MWNTRVRAWTVVLLIMAVSAVLSEPDVTLASAVVNYNSSEADEGPADEISSPLTFVSPMKNFTKVSGDSLKLKCEVKGSPPVSEFRCSYYKTFFSSSPTKSRNKLERLSNANISSLQSNL